MPKRLSGGYTDTTTISVFIGLIAFLVILAGLMWGGQINFATTQDLQLTASLITATAFLLMFYALYLTTSAASVCTAL